MERQIRLPGSRPQQGKGKTVEMWVLHINLEGTFNMVAMFQEYQTCVDGAQAYARLVPPPEKRSYQPWYVCRKELVNLPNPLVTPPHIVR
jgi:hypothetical protein